MDESGAPRVLVIEDDEDTANSIARLLKKKFLARVEMASDTRQARQLLATREFDLITLDYMLPDGDGLALLEEISLNPASPPVIMVTGHGDEGIASDALRFGASGYVQKDRRIADLLAEAVDKALIGARLKTAEESLRAQLKQLEWQASLLDAVSDVVFTTDAAFVIESWNKSAERVFGVPSEEALGVKSYDLLDIDYGSGNSREQLIEHLHSTGSYTGELTVRCRGGRPLRMEVNTWEARDGDGRVDGYLAIYREIAR